ncbi:phosphoenolpyruvate--protein phosphotransferase [Porticoccus sp.]|uniref:phosphoenolpyruvate--protein phosphotransferase n=1 Tax=Porticoccus sp. TaxID=2024853 RepID=UPI003F695DCB
MKSVVHELARIVQTVATADTPIDQVNLIVESISQTMAVDVCSLYLANEQREMLLLASHGLASKAVRNVKLPTGKGLVGLVATSRHPVNLADGELHPSYFYVAETREERFHSFCGVPIVYAGKVIGVLVVQSREIRELSEEEQGFLVTLAAHLALLLGTSPLAQGDMIGLNERVTGVKGAPGIGIGHIKISDQGELYSVLDAPCEDVPGTVEDWQKLLTVVRAQIEHEQASLGKEISGSVTGIFSAYNMLLEDPAFVSHVEKGIRAGNWLPGSLRQAVQHFAELFLKMDDPYLKARHEDIHHLGNKLFNAWRGIKPVAIPPDTNIVLVGFQVSVSDIALIPSDRLVGLVCFDGSGLSHTAVLANALGIPAVMGTGRVRRLVDNASIIVDGNYGQVLLNPGDGVLSEYQRLVNDRRALMKQLEKMRDLPAVTPDGVAVTLYTNTGLLADISPGLLSGAQGVGLYRTEIPFMVHDSFPSEEEQIGVYRQVLDAYRGKPVHMRTLDIGGDKQLPYFPVDNEKNPALGWRGVRFTLDNSQLLMTQVRAMIRAAEGMDNLRILLPMVSSTSELDDFAEIFLDAMEQLAAEGYTVTRPALGVMVEVPAAISQIPFWAGKIDFISIGSNDLSQYLLALDRDNPRVSGRYDHVHPAVLLEIQRILKLAGDAGVPVSLCGEMASDPVAVVLLLGLGMRTLSMSAAKLPQVKWLIRTLPIALAERLARDSLICHYPADIRKLVRAELENLGLHELFT